MISILLALSLPLMAQEATLPKEDSAEVIVTPLDNLKTKDLSISVRELQSGRPQITGVPNYINGLEWNGGTSTGTQTFNGTVVFNGHAQYVVPLTISSATYVPPGSLNAVLELAICYATVTVTLPYAMSGIFWHSGTMDNSAGGNQCKIAYLIDGALPDRFTKDIGLTAVVGANEINATAYDELPTLAAGEHSVCLAFAAQTGGGGVCTWPTSKFVAVQSINRFGVRFFP